MSEKFSRRNLFRLRVRDLAAAWGEASKELKKGAKPKTYVRPPGAITDEETFLDTCTRCHSCLNACPFDIIEIPGPLAGEAEGTPTLKLNQNPCHWCSTMDCIHACPSDALSMPEDGKVKGIGKVWLQPEACLNTEGIFCDTCVMYCPSDIRAIKMKNNFPVVDEKSCIGCGLCVYYCEAEPKALHWYSPQKETES
ncbi:MAG: 4Fe-4S dicluster domain-containing protein [Verrucomicrobia bacterium]|jgi:ferredoxin-type protein NapG|nr:4Fe-4S dicluster domain-containing protein [Verrucomicrobiota bacterium]